MTGAGAAIHHALRRAAHLGLLVAAGAAGAADETLRMQLEQRIKLTARLIADSPTAQRIGASGNAQAVAHLDEGRVHQGLAQDLLAKGDLPAARRAVDEALRHIGIARRMVPDAQAQQTAARLRNEHKLAQLERLLDAWREHAAPGAADAGERLEASGLIGSARLLGQQGRHDEAGQALEHAERQVLAGMNRVLNQRTLDYSVRPATPAQEFQLELSRHAGLAELVPLALSELRPRPEAVARVERYRASSQALLAQAVQQIEGGNATQALAHLRDAILDLQRALGAAGVRTPEPTGSPP